jgi:hypothetical protein
MYVTEATDYTEEYRRLVRDASGGMLYHSLAWRELLDRMLDAAVPHYLVAVEDGTVVGALPTFVYENEQFGNVLNSLPFFGSHGGVVVRDDISPSRRRKIKTTLLSYAQSTVVPERDCILSTIITTPYEDDEDIYERELSVDFRDYRIGQIKEFTDDSRGDLLYDVEKRCRTAVRKARKAGVTIRKSTDIAADIERLRDGHIAHMASIDGYAKPNAFFSELPNIFEQGTEYDLYLAEYEGNIICLVLLCYFGEFVEYLLPVTDPEYRSKYPTNLLIYEAMQDAMDRGFRYWNFGGTWESQGGVYRFKRSFEPTDIEYNYYINTHGDITQILSTPPEQLRTEYEYCYVVPFDELDENN